MRRDGGNSVSSAFGLHTRAEILSAFPNPSSPTLIGRLMTCGPISL